MALSSDCDFNDLFKTLYLKDEVIAYFKSFENSLHDFDEVISSEDVTKFQTHLKFLENVQLFNTIRHDNTEEAFANKLESVLLNILTIFYHRCLSLVAKGCNQAMWQHHDTLFNSTKLLLKILVDRVKDKNYFETLLKKLCSFVSFKSEQNDFFSDTVKFDHTLSAMKFMSNILQYIPESQCHSYVSERVLLELVKMMNISDPKILYPFVNHIYPRVMSLADMRFKRKIYDVVWGNISRQFNKGITDEKNLSLYVILCSVLEYENQYDDDCFSILYDIPESRIFWDMIQQGMTHLHPFTRKRALYIFKTLIVFLNKIEFGLNYTMKDDIPIFTIDHPEYFYVWSDIISICEALEENQEHLIKPILPKFDKIVKLTNTDKTKNREFILHTSWVVFIMKRMLSHSSKFVVRWGILYSLNLNFLECPIHKSDHCKLFINIILKAISDQSLYSRTFETNEFEYTSALSQNPLQERIKHFFTSSVLAFQRIEDKAKVVRGLLCLIADQSWNGVSLLHLSCAISNIQCVPAWGKEEIIEVRKLIANAKRAQDAILRGAIQCYLLESCIHLINWESVDFEDLAELLIDFSSKECFSRHTTQWNNFASKLKEVFLCGSSDNLSVDRAKKFCNDFVSFVVDEDDEIATRKLQKSTRMLMVLADASVICPLQSTRDQKSSCLYWDSLLDPLTVNLLFASRRPYMSQQKFLNSLQVFTFLIEDCQGHEKNSEDGHLKSLAKCIYPCDDALNFIFGNIFNDVSDAKYLTKLDISINFLYVASSVKDLRVCFCRVQPVFITTCVNILNDKDTLKKFHLQLQRTCALIFTIYNKNEVIKNFYEFFSKIILEDVLYTAAVQQELSKSTIGHEEWNKHANKSLCESWNCVLNGYFLLPNPSHQILSFIAKKAENILDTGPKSTIVPVIKCLKLTFRYLIIYETKLASSLIHASWNACLELRGNEAFRPALEMLARAMFQPPLLSERSFYEYVNKFMAISENSAGIFNFVVEPFCKNFMLKDISICEFDYIPFLTQALIYGPIHRKDQRVIDESIIYVIEQGENLAVNALLKDNCKIDSLVRVVAIKYLIHNMDYQNGDKVSKPIFKYLFTLIERNNESNTCKFANTYYHRLNNRIWQIVLVLIPCIKSVQMREEVLSRVINLMVIENQQPSIRYLQEWTIIKLLHSSPELFANFMQTSQRCIAKRLGFAMSLLSIFIWSLKLNIIKQEVNFYLPLILSLGMSQNFNARLYAHLTFKKLAPMYKDANCGDHPCSEIVTKLVQSLQTESGNVPKNLEKLENDFYFSKFHPINHFTLETIFFEMPRLSKMTYDEWISPSFFKKYPFLDNNAIPLYNKDNSLRNSLPTTWSATRSEGDVPEETNYNFQKKLIPCTDMHSDSDGFEDNQQWSKPSSDGLIVVASLIDRLPNLGGLCRTCEIFGVQEYVIGDLRYVEDKQFQNLAVSSDKWVHIKEIKPYNLKSYLLSLKDKGYTLVGAEQTDDSCMLTEYKFPKQTLLLLGHEKEGLPVDLITLLDACVEIPQQGVIRSLNVHVSGAILIWEYARQHL